MLTGYCGVASGIAVRRAVVAAHLKRDCGADQAADIECRRRRRRKYHDCASRNRTRRNTRHTPPNLQDADLLQSGCHGSLPGDCQAHRALPQVATSAVMRVTKLHIRQTAGIAQVYALRRGKPRLAAKFGAYALAHCQQRTSHRCPIAMEIARATAALL